MILENLKKKTLKKPNFKIMFVLSVLVEDDLKPPPYSECAQSNETDSSHLPHNTAFISEGGNSVRINEAPPPYTLTPPTVVALRGSPVNQSEHSQSRPN